MSQPSKHRWIRFCLVALLFGALASACDSGQEELPIPTPNVPTMHAVPSDEPTGEILEEDQDHDALADDEDPDPIDIDIEVEVGETDDNDVEMKTTKPIGRRAKTRKKPRAAKKVVDNFPDDRASDLAVLKLSIAEDVKDRQPKNAGRSFERTDRPLWAWAQLRNEGPPTQITMVWKRGKKVRSKVELSVGSSSGWRTWSKKTLGPKDAGNWSVEVLDAAGQRLARKTFVVRETGAAPRAAKKPTTRTKKLASNTQKRAEPRTQKRNVRRNVQRVIPPAYLGQ